MKFFSPKLFSALKGYSASKLVSDLVAGVIVAIIALPLSIALAIASGVSPQQGLYTAIVAGFVIAFLGGSRVNISGPTAAFATIVAGVVATHGTEGLILATVMAGILLILMGICRFGALIKYIPMTITTGFTAGIAVTILVGQIKDFLGLSYADGVKPVETLEKLEANFHALSTFHWQALLVGAVCLLILIVYPRFEKRVPPSLVAVIAGALMVKFIPGLDEGVYTIGELYSIPAGLPPFTLGALEISLDKMVSLLPDAATIAVLAAIESLLSCVVADTMVGSKHNSNAELLAQGAGNIVSVAFGGIPATGAIARTAANAKNGGRTPVAGMVHALVLLLVLLFLMPFAGLIPMPTIAAILFMVAYNMSEWRKFKRIAQTSPAGDTLVMAVTFALTVIFDLVVAIGVGIVLAALLFLRNMAKQTGVRSWKKEAGDGPVLAEGVSVFEVSGELFFGAADKIRELCFEENTQVAVLRMGAVSSLDATALEALEDLLKKAKAAGVRLCFAHVNEQPMKLMKKSGFFAAAGEENFFPHVFRALDEVQK